MQGRQSFRFKATNIRGVGTLSGPKRQSSRNYYLIPHINIFKMASNDHFNMAIVGTGSIAGHFFKSIADLPNATVVGMCSSSADRAAAASEKYGVPVYHDLQTLLNKKEVDVVCICTASGQHLEPALVAARQGKHIICEKPLEVSNERAQQIIDVCEEHNVVLAGIFQNRYSKDYQDLKSAVDAGMLGKLLVGNAYIKWYRDDAYYASSPWRGTIKGDGGAAFINQGIHTIDLLLHIMGDVDSVFARTRTMTHDIEGEDVGIALLEFKNGALGAIQASTSMWPGYPERLEIFGEKGSVIMEGGKITAWNIQGVVNKTVDQSSGSPSGSSDPMAISYHLHRTQIGEILDNIRAGTSPKVDGAEAVKALRLIKAIYQSSADGKAVPLSV